MLDDKTDIFEQHRATLEGVAYRMLGTLSEASDVVQDTYIKWHASQTDDIENSRAWLITVCSRLALNLLQSARSKRESYFGVWLPEPFMSDHSGDATSQMELDESISIALLLALEKLTPAERATFLLHDVFNYSFDEIALTLRKSNASCRQNAARARKQIRIEKPRFTASCEDHQQLLQSFLEATQEGELQPLTALLADSVKLYSDGGGKVEAIPHILCGSSEVSAFFLKIWQNYSKLGVSIHVTPSWFNGSPGILIYENDTLSTAITLDTDAGQIQRIYAIRNPEKLTAFAN